MTMSKRKLRDFYNEFFNNKYFRDIDYIRGKWGSFKDADPKDNTDRLRYGVKNLFNDAGDMSKFKKSARYFMLKKQHRDGHGQLVHHNSYFKNPADFHSNSKDDRLYDRLFFDIDKHDDTIDGFKHKIADIKARRIGTDIGYTHKQKLRDIKKVQKRYREYIFNNDFLKDPFNDAMKVMDFYRDRGTEPVLISTSGAGFHLNVFFKPVHLQNPSDVFLSYTKMISDKTGVPMDNDDIKGMSCLDDAPPKNAVIGTQRTPYSVHEKSGLYGFIIPADWTYDDYMTQLEKNRLNVHDFTYDDHIVPDVLSEQIIKMDSLAGQKKEQKKEQYKQERSRNSKSWTVHVKGLGDVSVGVEHQNSLSDDLRVLWDLMVSDGKCEPVQEKDIREHYNRVRCPFPDHEDKNPSAICGKYRFKCFKCCPDGINWYMLIAVTYGIIDPDDIKKNPSDRQKQEIKNVIRKLMGKSQDT